LVVLAPADGGYGPMGYVRETVYIQAPIERVWEFVTDYKRFPEWQTNVFEIKDVDGTPGTVGFAYTAFFKAFGKPLEGKFKIIKAERPRYIEEQGIFADGKMLTTTVFESTPEGFASVTFTVDYEFAPSFLISFDRPMFEHYLERELKFANETLKQLLELPVPVLA
jgi:uncharacterized protein YndB with AHSA1/START domain